MRTTTRMTASIAMLSLLLLAASPALAGTSRQVFVAEGTSLAGVEIEQGFYKLMWKRNGSPDSYVVSLHRGGKVIAKAEGKTASKDAAQSDGLAYRSDGNGGREIAEIRFAGKKDVIAIGG